MLESEFIARATRRDVARLIALRNIEIREENREERKRQLRNNAALGKTQGRFKR